MKQNDEQKRRPRKILMALLMLNWKSSALGFPCSSVGRHAAADRHCLTMVRPHPTNLQFAVDVTNSDDEFISSVLYEGTFQAMDDGMLAYLRDGGKTMPSKTRRLMSQITSEYVYGVEGRPNLSGRGVIEVLDSEYETLPASVVVGSKTFGSGCGPGRRDDELLVVQIASLAILYGLPAEILLKIVDCVATDNQAMTDFRSEFESVGWEGLSFPAGLGLRVRKGLVCRTTQASSSSSSSSVGQSFFPPSRLPWRSRSSRRAAEAAQRGIELAAEAEAPEQTFMTKEEFLVEIENEIHATPPLSEVVAATTEPITSSSSGTLALGDALPSFPSQRYSLAWKKVKRLFLNPSFPFANSKAWKKFSTVWNTQYNKLKGAGRAGLMAYAFLNFVLYTVGMTWQWRRIAVEVPHPAAGATLLSLTIRKFIKAFTRVYVGAAVFKLVRIVASIALVPAADRVLRFTQRKLKVSENTAFLILITLLLKTFFGTLAIVCLGDSALRQALRTPLDTAATAAATA